MTTAPYAPLESVGRFLLAYMTEQETIAQLRQQVLDLEGKLSSQKWQIRMKDEALRSKNLALDAYHHVWCDGSCRTGVHRYHKVPLTREIVLKAEYNTRRLRTKYNNLLLNAARKQMTDEENEQIRLDVWVNKTRDWSAVVNEILERFKDLELK